MLIVSILTPIFLIVSAGFLWARSGREFNNGFVTQLSTQLGLPCLVFAAIAPLDMPHDTIFDMALAAAGAYALFLILGALSLSVLGLWHRAHLTTISMPNIGNLGLPLCSLAFGPEGLALAVTYFAVSVTLQLSLGLAVIAGTFSLKRLMSMPALPATIIACVFLFTGTAVPKWLLDATTLLGGISIPLMLLALGVSLNHLNIGSLKTALTLSVLRFGIGFATGVSVAMALGLEGAARGVLILQCSTSTAVMAYLLSEQFGQKAQEVAGTVVVSSVMAVAVLPLVLAYVL